MITTSKAAARALGPCKEGWVQYLETIGRDHGDDQPVPYTAVVAAIGLEDALWTARAIPEHEEIWRSFAVWCAAQARQAVGGNAPQKTAAQEWADRSEQAANCPSWQFAVWKAPLFAAEAYGWLAFDRGEDFKAARLAAMDSFKVEFISRIGG